MRDLTIITWIIILFGFSSGIGIKGQGKGESFTSAVPVPEAATGWRGPSRDGIFPGSNLLTHWPEGGPELLWKYDSLGSGFSSAAVTTGRVFTVGTIDSTSYVFSFDIAGNLLWRKALGKDWMVNFPGIRSTPTIYDGTGYIVNGIGVLYCFNAENGDIIWKRDLIQEDGGRNRTWGFVDNLIIDGDRLYCTPAGTDNNIIALNRKNGDLIWAGKGNGEGNAYCTPVIMETGGKRFFINQPGKAYVSVDTENGEMAWKYEKQEEHISAHHTPIIRDNYLFGLDDEATGCVMLKIAEDGYGANVAWRNPEIFNVSGEAVVLGDRIYCPGMNDKIYCVDWNTGKTIFSQIFGRGMFILISAEHLLYSYDWKGNFSLLKPCEDRVEAVGSFRIRGGNPEHFSHPVIKDGRLYVRHDNSLFVYNISKETH